MTHLCRDIEERFIAGGKDAVAADNRLVEHAASCPNCIAFLEALNEVEQFFSDLPLIEAPKATVEQTIAAVASRPLPGEKKKKMRLRTTIARCSRLPVRRAMIFPAGAVLAALLALIIASQTSDSRKLTFFGQAPGPAPQNPAQTSPEAYEDLIIGFKEKIAETDAQLKKARTDIERLTLGANSKHYDLRVPPPYELDAFKEKTASILQTLAGKVEDLGRNVDSMAAKMQNQQDSVPLPSTEMEGPDDLEAIGFDETNVPEPAGPAPEPLASDPWAQPSTLAAATSAALEELRAAAGQAQPVDNDVQKRLSAKIAGTATLPGNPNRELYVAGNPEADSNWSRETTAANSSEQEAQEQFKDLSIALVSPGDFAPVALASKVRVPAFAPGMPLALQLKGPITHRWGRAEDFSEAKLLAEVSSYGADGRADVRLLKLILTRPNGEQMLVDVNGWVTDEHGQRGIPLVPAVDAQLPGTCAVDQVIEALDPQRKNTELNKFLQDVIGRFDSEQCGKAALGESKRFLLAGETSLRAVFSSSADIKKNYSERAGAVRLAAFPDSAEQFLAAQNVTEGLVFKDPTGYWANTYVPGDESLRTLHTSFLQRDRSFIETAAAKRLKLHDLSRRNTQPFDKPEDSALALYVHGDRRGAAAQSRLLLQVGLQATSRHSGHRPALNIGLLVDLRGPVSPEYEALVRETVLAVNNSKLAGDRYSVIAAGRQPQVLVQPQDFTRGYISVALNNALRSASSSNLAAMLETAVAKVREADDPNSALGSSAVLLITGQPIGADLALLKEAAHRSAVSGIPVSVIALGKDVPQAELNELAIAGEGTRRLVSTVAEAQNVVQQQLAAVGEVVARALRLRIRLAPGVKLVDVIGSRKLNEEQSEQTRRSENSIDQRIAKNLGITADRGEDEEGIQIVIPSFYAGDAHIILLDLVVPGAGPVADVQLRYKDLVFLRNGTTVGSFALEQNEKDAGPLEQNVLKNLLALRFGTTLEQAGEAVAHGGEAAAVRAIKSYQNLLSAFRLRFSTFGRDTDIDNDLQMLGDYLAALESHPIHPTAQREYLAGSLQLAGKLKVLPRFSGE